MGRGGKYSLGESNRFNFPVSFPSVARSFRGFRGLARVFRGLARGFRVPNIVDFLLYEYFHLTQILSAYLNWYTTGTYLFMRTIAMIKPFPLILVYILCPPWQGSAQPLLPLSVHNK